MTKTKSTIATAAEHKLEEFAEDLGKLLGTARAKAEGWLSQRQAIVKTLTELRNTATRLLADLGHEADSILPRRGRPVGALGTVRKFRVTEPVKPSPSRPKGSGKKKRTMSAAARAKISAAQKARWAKQKAGGKKEK